MPFIETKDNTLADDLTALLGSLDLDHVCLVAHSPAGGEVIRYQNCRVHCR